MDKCSGPLLLTWIKFHGELFGWIQEKPVRHTMMTFMVYSILHVTGATGVSAFVSRVLSALSGWWNSNLFSHVHTYGCRVFEPFCWGVEGY